MTCTCKWTLPNNENWLTHDVRYQVQINGMSGVFSAFLVAFKHLIPEHRIAILGGRVSIRVKVIV